MKVWKKFSAIALTLVMALALCAPAFAVEADGDFDATGGVVGDFEDEDTTREDEFTDVVIMYKEITAFNPESSTVNAPTITYTYTITPGSADKDIYDAKDKHTANVSVHVKTKAGIGTPAITGSVNPSAQTPTWTNNTLVFTPTTATFTASSSGASNKFPLKVDFSDISFTDATTTTGASGAGVYRYVITETVAGTASTVTDAQHTAAKNAAGIEDGTISNVRYMDVYVNGAGDIYGWVCFAYDHNIDAQDTPASNNDVVDKAFKTEGFVAGTDSSTNTDVTADAYYTFNFEVAKMVDNDNYAVTTAHQFPFTIKLDNADVTAAVLPIMTFTDELTSTTPDFTPTYDTSATNVTQTALSASAIGTDNDATTDTFEGTTWEPTISHNTAVKYVGIPCGTTVTIYETNDVSSVTYYATIENADTVGDAASIYTDDNSNEAVIETEALTTPDQNYTATDEGAVTFTNTLLDISPTGVVLRYAPYLAMMGAGVVALPLSLRKKEELF